jgi:hypothetical protein
MEFKRRVGRVKTAALIFLLLMGCAAGAKISTKDVAPTYSIDPQKVVRNGDWELRVWYRLMGSRSEGQHGALYFQGSEVSSTLVGAERETSLGRMKYYGWDPSARPWQPSGWNYADAARIKPSWSELPAQHIDEKPVGQTGSPSQHEGAAEEKTHPN